MVTKAASVGEVVDPPRLARLEGLDLARALAFAGMLFAHFAFSLSADDPGWLQVLDEIADGRAAPLFCVLLGVGAGLLVRSGAPDRVLVVRGALLGAIGLAIWPLVGVVYLILPHYGLLLALVPLLRRIPTGWMLPAAVTAFVVPSVITAVVDDHGMRLAPQPGEYADLADLPELLRMLVWTGGYPLVGWVGFVLVGLWLSRQRLDERRVQVALLAAGGAIALAQPLLSWWFAAVGGLPAPTAERRAPAGSWAAFLDGSAHSNRFAWYLLASATAVAVIAGCLLLVGAVPGRWRVPFVRLGQLALTAYLAHLFIGEQWVWPWIGDAKPALVVQVVVLLAVLVGLMAFATAWRWRFRRGPVETCVRAVSRSISSAAPAS
jgi:uncharacterized membrane protein YeiB